MTMIKPTFVLFFLALAGWAQESPQAPITPARRGYEVTVEVTVEPDGKISDVKPPQTEFYTLGQLAVSAARGLKLVPQTQNGHAVKSVQRVPLFFAVEGDEGPEAMQRPLPRARVQPAPAYPFAMREAGKPGGAIVSLEVDAKGRVAKCHLLRASDKSFGDAALQAAKLWQFVPASQGGKPVASRVNVAFAFEINDGSPEWKWYLAPRPALDAYVVSTRFVLVPH